MFRDSETDLRFLPKFFFTKAPENPNWSPPEALLGIRSLKASVPTDSLLQDRVPERCVQHTSDYAVFKMSLFPVSEAYNPLSLA